MLKRQRPFGTTGHQYHKTTVPPPKEKKKAFKKSKYNVIHFSLRTSERSWKADFHNFNKPDHLFLMPTANDSWKSKRHFADKEMRLRNMNEPQKSKFSNLGTLHTTLLTAGQDNPDDSLQRRQKALRSKRNNSTAQNSSSVHDNIHKDLRASIITNHLKKNH